MTGGCFAWEVSLEVPSDLNYSVILLAFKEEQKRIKN